MRRRCWSLQWSLTPTQNLYLYIPPRLEFHANLSSCFSLHCFYHVYFYDKEFCTSQPLMNARLALGDIDQLNLHETFASAQSDKLL